MTMSKKILLVDDAAFMRKMVRDTLSKSGYTVFLLLTTWNLSQSMFPPAQTCKVEA